LHGGFVDGVCSFDERPRVVCGFVVVRPLEEDGDESLLSRLQAASCEAAPCPPTPEIVFGYAYRQSQSAFDFAFFVTTASARPPPPCEHYHLIAISFPSLPICCCFLVIAISAL
jgi:hypothetical protein